MFEGRPPFTLLAPKQAAVAACLKGMRPQFQGLLRPRHERLKGLIARCWAPVPEDRPDFTELIPELEACLAQVKEWEAANKKKKKIFAGWFG